MADLYAPQTQFLNTNGGQSQQEAPQGITGNADVDAYLSSLPESERNAALTRLTAPPSGEELSQMVKSGYRPTLDEFDAIESWHKTHEVNIVDGIGAGIEQVMGDLGRAAGAVADHPMDVLSKSPANVVEAFSQGTRNFYGMLAQSADPTSKLFRFKNFLNGTGTKEERYNQYMEALDFNRESAELMEGKKTLVVDKDLINPEVVQAASYIADPTLFIPFGAAASAGMRAVGLGEKMMLAGAKASAIKNAVIGGTLKWGVGAPVEFLGGAVRNTIDFGINQGARAIEATTGIGAKEIAQTARLSGVPMSAASFAGHSIPYAGAVSEAYVGASAARGLGEAATAIGDTMLKNKSFGRGINSWAREALENTPNLSGHAKGLLKVLDAVDPAFTYGAAVTQGAAHGAMIGGTLGYLSGGEEGFAHGLGAGIALGGVGGGVGKGVADVTNQTLYGRVAVQRKMTIEGLKALGTTEATNKAMAFEALVKSAELSGDRHYMAHIDGMIAGVDKVAPRSKWFVRGRQEHIDWLLKQEIDPTTGKLIENKKLFPEFGSDRKARGRALGFLSLLGDQFAGVPDNLVKHLATLPQDHALRKAFFRLSGEQKAAVFEAIKNNANPEFRKSLGETQGVQRVSDANYDKWVKDNYEYFDPSNPENNAVLLREKLKQINGSTPEGKKEANTILERIKHIEEVKKQYNDWANGTTPEARAKADAAMQDAWKGRGSRQMAEPIKPQKANKPKISEYYGDINYGEMNTARVNELFAKGDIDGAKKLIGQFLKDNTNKDGSLNTRGRILRNKLAADGYFDKDGNLRPRRYTDNDAQPTAGMYASNEGFVLKRDATGEIEVHISLDNITKDGVAHELFHAIFKESVLKPDFIDRLSKDLLGTFDKDGKLVKAGSVRRNEIREFFRRYIDLTTDKESDFKDEMARLESAIKEFETGSEAKSISPDAIATLHQYAEEFGAYYFQNWLRAQSPDFLFRGGKLDGIRGIMDGIKNGWLDFWERTMQSKDPTFDFKSLKEGEIDGGFKKVNGKRVRVSSLDYFMRDFVRATSDTNRGNFDINKLSPEGQAQYIQSNGLRNTHRVDSTGRAVRLSRREAAKANALAGKEIYKILKGINPNRAVDGDGNFIGRLSEAELDAIVKSGHAPRAWANKLRQAYEILDGKQSNVVEFGYHGKTEQLTDASYPRLFGDDVSFKHRKAILLDVELKVGEKGTFYALFHTLDKSVIEARGDNLWKDSAIQSLWDGNRGSMEQDFFRYLENASKPEHDQSKKPSAELWTDGKGAQRRDALHQMLGMAKNEGDTFINRPIAEIPLGIRHSVTTFNNDGVSSFRVSGTERYNYNHDNAFKLLSRNWKPSEMRVEKTGLGEILTHPTGFKFIKYQDGSVKAFTSAGLKIGTFDNIEAAAKAGEKFSDSIYDNMQDALVKDIDFQNKQATRFKPLSKEARLEAIAKGDVFALQEMKDFVGNRTLLRQTRDEHIYQRALESVSDPEKLLALAEKVVEKNALVREEYNRMMRELTLEEQAYEKGKDDWLKAHNEKTAVLRKKYGVFDSFFDWRESKGLKDIQEYITDSNGNFINNPEWNPSERTKLSAQYYDEQSAKMFKLEADTEHKALMGEYAQWTDFNDKEARRLIDIEEKIQDWKKKNYEAMNDPILAELESGLFESVSRQEKADMFAGLVEAAAKQREYSGLLEAMFAGEYDDQIQTGKPFVAVTTHGTGNVELMMSRLFASDKLGSNYSIPSSRMGSFSAGSQNTSKAYAKRPRIQTLDFKERKYDVMMLDPAGHQLYLDYNQALNKAISNDYNIGKTELNAIIEKHGKPDSWGTWSLTKTNPELAERYFKLVGEAYSMSESAFTSQHIRKFEKGEGIDFRWVTNDIVDKMQKINEYYVKNTPNFPDADMQLRKVIRMDNPYVVVDPRSYTEHYISPHMKKAMEAGHDGIIFKRFADGGERDNVYVVFKDFMADNIKVIDTSFDGEQVPRGKDNAGRVLKGGRELGLRFKPIEWIRKDLMNHPENRQAWDRITGSGAVVQNFDIKELQGKPVLNIAPDNAFTGQLMVGDELVMKGQGGVLFAVNNIEQGGIWASSTTGAKRMFEAMKTLRNADLAKGGDGTVYISIPKAISSKVSSSENGARGYMNVINQLAKNNIIPKEIVQNAIRETVKKHKGILDKNGKEMSLSGSGFDVLNRAMDAFFSEDNAKFKGRGSFVEKLVTEITSAIRSKKDPKKLLDAQKTFDSDAPNLLTSSEVLMEAIGKLFDDPLTKDLNVGDVYAVIKVSGDFDMKQVRMHDSYNTTIVHKSGAKPQLLLLDKPKNMTEFIDSVENKDISSDKSSYTPEELKAFYEDVNKRMDEAKPRGLKGSPLNEGHNPNDFYGINSSGQAAGRFKAALKPREEVIQRAKEAGYKPTVYYHGTPKDFTEFKSDVGRTMGGREGATAGYFFFTPNEGEAKGIHGSASEGSTNVMQVFLKYENPFNTSYGKTPSFTEKQKARIIDFYRENASYAGSRDYLADVVSGYLDRKDLAGTFKYLTRPQRAELLKSLGFDSLIDKGNHIVVFDPEQIKSAKDFTYDDAGKEIPLSERFDKTKKDIRWKPSEPEEGGRIYDPTSREFRTKFIGKWAEENPERVKGYNIEFIDRGSMGGYRNPNAQNVRIRMQDNSKKGKTIDVGHITAQIDHNSRVATLSSNISPEYRGNKLSYALYSEMAERLRSMGIKYVDGQIVNPEGIPVRVREKIIGDTRMLARDGSYQSSRPISQKEASTIIKRRQAMGGQWEGIDVLNELDKNARYKPLEGDEGIVPDIDFDALIREEKERQKGSYKGKQYTPEEMTFAFVGRHASERPDLIKGKELMYSGSGTTRSLVLSDSKTGERIGSIGFYVQPNAVNKHAFIQISDVKEKYQGRGFGTLLYSELAERLRSEGYTSIDGRIVDELRRPFKIRASVIDEVNKELGGKVTSVSGERVSSPLYPDAQYKPKEGWRDWKSESTSIGSVVKNTIGYVIMNQGNKFKVYNPAKTMVGIYTDLEQAKRRVQRDEPK